MYNEDLLKEKEKYSTEQDRFDKIFKHKSTAMCGYCKLPLFSQFNTEKTKSIHCGSKFHVVGCIITSLV